MKKKNLFVVAMMLLTALIFTACSGGNDKAKDTGKGGSGSKDSLKVALLLSGPANDQGWNATAVEGLDKLKEKHDVETTFMENVTVADMESAYTDYASQGYDLIIGHGFQFGQPAAKVSETFPDQYFMATESNSKAKNMSSYVMSCEQGGYLMGALAASMSETKVIGVIGGVEQPSIIKEVEAFKAAAKEINPDIKILESYVNSFTDVTAGKAAATSMLDQGADVIYQVANQAGTGVIKACEERGVYALGNSYDQSSVAPNTVLCSTVYRMPEVINYALEEVIGNKFGDSVTYLGIKDKVVDITFNKDLKGKIPEDVVKKIEDLYSQIESGKLEVPLKEEKTK
ncbi:BMP family protein [Miniphocaeibacter massiliensis]|uniref:BMP family protein n=1 Tax=Miniphocaeibacter massiliensis TaxID=2041841 RepID=UPI000C1C0027|nr:BMP family protein [Miniphocaeibacter massiliensis]